MSDPLDLATVIASVESGNNPYAMRFEPGLYAEWTKDTLTPARRDVVNTAMEANKCSFGTALMIACTSWGPHQILGENLYSVCALPISVGAFMAGAAHDYYFTKFLVAKGIAYDLDVVETVPAEREHFIATYNGPANTAAYWARMQDAIKRLSGTVDQT
jgi:hypothetical protein